MCLRCLKLAVRNAFKHSCTIFALCAAVGVCISNYLEIHLHNYSYEWFKCAAASWKKTRTTRKSSNFCCVSFIFELWCFVYFHFSYGNNTIFKRVLLTIVYTQLESNILSTSYALSHQQFMNAISFHFAYSNDGVPLCCLKLWCVSHIFECFRLV